jgi:tetratricopeptide (TPR) repeat protein
MRLTIVAVLCVSLAVASVARADLKKGTYAPDLEANDWMNTDGEPISLAECRGMIVVLFFWVSWHEGGESIMPLMTLVNASQYGHSAGVFLIGLTDADRVRVADILKKEKVFFPVGMEAKKSFEDYDISSYPRVVIIDANGKVAWTGWPGEEGDRGGNRLVEEIGKVVAETPPTKTHPEEAAKAESYLQQARQALREDRFREAHKAASNAFDHALRGDALKTRCQDMLDLIEALGRDKLAQAERALDEKNFEDAVTLLVELRREFRGVDVAAAVKKKIAALKKKHAEIEQILKQQEDVGQAETILASAMDALRDRRFGLAYEKLEDIANEYGSTPTAGKAQTMLDRIQKNQGIMGYVRDYKAARPCRTLLSQAEAYERTGRTNRARDLYREIIDKYPDTVYAEDAAERLKRLP